MTPAAVSNGWTVLTVSPRLPPSVAEGSFCVWSVFEENASPRVIRLLSFHFPTENLELPRL